MAVLDLMDVSANGEDVAYTYDSFSRLLTAAYSAGHTLSYAYDQLSRLTSAQSPLGAVSYQYDAAGRRTRITWPDGYYAEYVYNTAGDLTDVNAGVKLHHAGGAKLHR